MELKLKHTLSALRGGIGFNRTFMELKLGYIRGSGAGSLVLIGPSWN